MKKRILSLILAAVMYAALVVPASAAGGVFADVPSSYWAAEQIEKAHALGMVGGYADGTYRPGNALTGAHLVAMVARRYCAGKINVEAAHDAGISCGWYDGELYALLENGYLNGIPFHDGYAATMDKTAPRELLVAILYNVAGQPAVDRTVLDQYADKGTVSEYAVDGFAWAVSNGVVNGTSTTTLSPQGSATRAQVAVILIRYIEKFEETAVGTQCGTYKTADEMIKTLPNESQNYLIKKKTTVLTNPCAVNDACGIRKKTQTLGYTEKANRNGYHTEANVDISGVVLDYEALAVLNKYREERWNDGERNAHEMNNSYEPIPYTKDMDLEWAIGDVAEESVCAGAKYKECAEYCGIITVSANSVEEALNELKDEGRIVFVIAPDDKYVAVAYFDGANGNRTYAFLSKRAYVNPAGVISNAEDNYGYGYNQ